MGARPSLEIPFSRQPYLTKFLLQKNYDERKEKRRDVKHPEPVHGPPDTGRRSYDLDRSRGRDLDRDDRRRDRRDNDRDYDREKRFD